MIGMQHCGECGFNNHWTDVPLANCKQCGWALPSSRALSEEEQSLVRGCRNRVQNWCGIDAASARLLLTLIDRLSET